MAREMLINVAESEECRVAVWRMAPLRSYTSSVPA